EQIAAWLSSDVPPLAEGSAKPQVKLLNPQSTTNDFGQEMFSAKYERAAVVRALASDLSVVLLPATGGRAAVPVNPGILIQPQNAGDLFGILQHTLDHRGRLRSGMRVYLEMHAASINAGGKKAERVSDVVWLGSDK